MIFCDEDLSLGGPGLIVGLGGRELSSWARLGLECEEVCSFVEDEERATEEPVVGSAGDDVDEFSARR